MVACQLPMLNARVRFSLPAPDFPDILIQPHFTAPLFDAGAAFFGINAAGFGGFAGFGFDAWGIAFKALRDKSRHPRPCVSAVGFLCAETPRSDDKIAVAADFASRQQFKLAKRMER